MVMPKWLLMMMLMMPPILPMIMLAPQIPKYFQYLLRNCNRDPNAADDDSASPDDAASPDFIIDCKLIRKIDPGSMIKLFF